MSTGEERRRLRGEATMSKDYYEPPDLYISGRSVSLFLAGGITGCPDWQSEVRAMLEGSGIVVINPRRAEWPIDDPTASHAQIAWEHYHLRASTAILFWFCAETVQPITLFELGAWHRDSKVIAIGAHPDYSHREDVVIQTSLSRAIPTFDSLEDTVDVARTILTERIETRRVLANAYEFYNG